MKTTMVIPSYWRREEALETKESDTIYDHPTPVDEDGTLARALESISTLHDKDFDLIIIAASNARDVEKKVEQKVRDILSATPVDVPVYLFSHSHLQNMHLCLKEAGGEEYMHLLKLSGYSNIRNLCLFLPHVLDSEIAVLIDDDEIFEDPQFIRKAREFIGKTIDSDFIGAVAGYYLQPDGDWRLQHERKPWMKHWDKLDKMNEAFEQIIGHEPRLKQTPFVFGGNMIVHRDIFRLIPFDPIVTRGEDIDYLINMRMHGYKFFLDNTLAIKHLPPPKTHPTWKQLREDIFRFVRERAKLRSQEPLHGMVTVTAEELDPYPGAFLKDDLEQKIADACRILADIYRKDGNEEDAIETLRNIEIVRIEAAKKENNFRRFMELQHQWRKMMQLTGRKDVRKKLQEIL
ncbi:MAG: glycosyltransferase [Thermodesulfobacteriota bacterium]|nr:glycosyltransferase [Thermodesulfobacteriota bacterium]